MKNDPEPAPYMTADEVAAKLGTTRLLVDRLRRRQAIPAVRLGRNVIRFLCRDVEAALEKLTLRAL